MKIRFTIPFPDWIDRMLAPLVLFYREIRYGKPYRRIHLTDGYYAKVDQQDFYNLNKYDWCVQETTGGRYAVRFNNLGSKPRILAMHRVIMNAATGALIDHQGREGLDNRRENLRLATRSENGQNKRKLKNTSSKYLGVSFRKRLTRWMARITVNKRMIYLGCFNSETDAARAYDAAALKYYGPNARLNFP